MRRRTAAPCLAGQFASFVPTILALVAVTLVPRSPAADVEPPTVRALTGKPWVDMDYGPFLTASIDCGQPRTNLAYKGIAIRVGAAFGSRNNEAVVFDTDLLRYAAGWTGDFVALKGVVFDGEHWAYPQIAGREVFGNAMQPGWSKAGSFADPREHPFGPLPREWARWGGLYLDRDRVVLRYTVGGTQVLEMPGLVTRDETAAFSRSLERGPSTEVQELQVAFEPGWSLRLLTGESLAATTGVTAVEGVLAVLAPPTSGKAAGQIPAAGIEGGLVGCWEFERLAGQTAPSEPPGHGALTLQGVRQTGQGRAGGALEFGGNGFAVWDQGATPLEFLETDFSMTAWIKTAADGVVFAQAPRTGNWVPDGKALFIRDGRLTFDVGWVGALAGTHRLTDDLWHHVGMRWSRADGQVTLFVDGAQDASGILKPRNRVQGHGVRFGFASPNFPAEPWFKGAMDGLRLYGRALADTEMAALAGVEVREEVLAGAVVGAPPGTEWVRGVEGNLRLRLPVSPEPARFKVLVWRGHPESLSAFARLVQTCPPAENLQPLTRGGPPRWPQRLETRGQRGSDDGPYAIDTLTAPDDNPWHSWLRFGGLDFFDDGRRAAVCTWNGDVWTVEGVDGDLAKLTWQRIATGLFQPLGLKIVNDQVYVLGRDQITRLHDLNGDGEADWYENFNNDCMVSEHFHEFALDLKTDSAGNFYYIKCARHALPALHPHHGTLLKLPPDGSRLEVVARGFRAVNGLGVGPHGELTSVDNQGHWMPANRINWIKPGGWYGNQWAWNPDGRTNYDEPLCWMHNFVDRSGGTHLWVPDDRWGTVSGQMITISYGMGHIFAVLSEDIGGVMQGGVTRFPLEFETGVMRGVFHPGNGQLYTAGLYGWAGNKTRAGGLYRVRYTGKALHLPQALNVASDGVVISFTDPLDPETATDPGNYDVTAWNYLWTANYGSPDLKPNGQEGRERLTVESATLAADRRAVFLKLPGIQRVMQMHIVFKLRGADGIAFENFIHHTVHRLGTEPGARRLGLGALARDPAEEMVLRHPAPGLVQQLELLAPGDPPPTYATDTRRARLPALHVPSQAPASPFLAAGPFRSTWRGFLQLDLNDERQFRFQGAGKARLRIGGETVIERGGPQLATGEASAPVALRRGPNRFELVYESPAKGDAGFRVLWSAKGQPFEPISPMNFVHEADEPALVRGETLRHGRNLFLRHQCAKCHRPDPQSVLLQVPEVMQDAPNLDGVGSRLNAAWVARYLVAPSRERDEVLMPAVLRGTTEEVNRDAADLAAFLNELRAADFSKESRSAPGGALKERATGEWLQAGRAHFERLGCGACHLLAGETRLTEDTRISLAHVSAKWREPALVRFLEKPSRDHAWTRMPDFGLNTEEAVSLAAFLRGVDGQGAVTVGEDETGAERLGQGQEGAGTERLAGVSPHLEERLAGVSPHLEERLAGVSPHLEERLAGVSPHLEERLDGVSPHREERFDGVSPHRQIGGDPARGRELLVSSGCLNCHPLTGFTSRLEAPSLAGIAASDWQRGCLADQEAGRGPAPDFGFTAADRTALRALARIDGIDSLGRETPAEFAERQTVNRRCNACHARDGTPHFWSRLTSAKAAPAKNDYGEEDEAASGSVHLGRPELTLAGEKLHGEWMQRLLGGTLGYKPRPEAQGRMPAFGVVADVFGAGLAHQHGLGAARQPRPGADPARAVVGQKLTLIEGGFGCVSCHGVAKQTALAGPDTATINFAFVADRLRPEYFRRYVRDPQRFRPGTMMPSFIAEDGSTPIKGVLDGKATEQFDAIWQYLLSLEPTMAAP